MAVNHAQTPRTATAVRVAEGARPRQRLPAARRPARTVLAASSLAELRHAPWTALIPASYRIQGMADPSNSISIDASP
jgi:hypothetical protein